ncbi:hypothetical protein I4U23_011472 [Adineta vaga]|nr:hypothetical protein I4U23_011472 [Adineta vaga]
MDLIFGIYKTILTNQRDYLTKDEIAKTKRVIYFLQKKSRRPRVNPINRICLWEEGRRQHYYPEKFNIYENEFENFRLKVTEEYLKDLC